MISAQYFDGASTRLHPVHLVPEGGQLRIDGDGLARHIAIDAIRIREPFEHAPVILDFKDGSHCAVHQGDGRSALLAALGYTPSRVERLQQRWRVALGAIMSIAGLLVFSYIVLLPMLTDRIAERLPTDSLHALGNEVERTLHDRGVLGFSLLGWGRHDQVQRAFDRIKPKDGEIELRVKLRDARSLGPNAMALPNGTIIVTDAMLQVLDRANPGQRDDLATEERLAAVLAHEIAHMEKRHALRKLVRSSISLAATWALWGDFSGGVGLASVSFSQAKFSREMEAEADARAIDILTAHGISPVRMAEVFEAMQANDNARPTPKNRMPGWMQTSLGYLASHPAPAERIAAIRAAAR